MDNNLTEEQILSIKRAFLRNRTIDAIKLYKEYTGVKMGEAINEMKNLAIKLKEEEPEKYSQLTIAKELGLKEIIIFIIIVGLLIKFLI